MQIKHYAVLIGVLVLAVIIAGAQYGKDKLEQAKTQSVKSEVYLDGTFSKLETGSMVINVDATPTPVIINAGTRITKQVALFGKYQEQDASVAEFKAKSKVRVYYMTDSAQPKPLYEVPASRIVLMAQ